MCGIAGQVRWDGRPVERALVERMCAAIEHRGPDSRGLHMSDGAGLGIQRLRVIDLETGDQPIYNEDGSVAVILNGEIYNYRELREELARAGHRFATDGDTEVIAHLYEEHGPGFVSRLHGMFGLAVWDAPRRRLVLARDRIGKKPLFYALTDGALSFGSELGALMQDPALSREPDHQALDAYLAYRYVPAPLTAFRAVRKLPPASVMTVENGRTSIATYWRLDYSTEHDAADERELAEELRDQIRRAVRRRMVADVPLGAFLSGGIDSSAVVAAMAEASSQPVRTFSIGFTSDDYDELPKARLVADRFATDHEEFVVEPKAIEIIPRIVQHYGEPFADSSAIPSFYVAKMARKHVTVALNGDGGDESFAGYTRYVSSLALHHADRVPRPLRRGLARFASAVPASGRIDSWPSRARRALAAVALDPAARHTAYMTELNGLDRDRLYTPEYKDLVGDSIVADVISTRWANSTAADHLGRSLDVDVHTYLPDDLLVKMDVATMAYGLEARSPLLDHELMEFAASLPSELKLRRGSKKVLLRTALRGWVPDAVLDAPKRGFCVPLADWFRGDLREFANDVLLDERTRARGYFEPLEVEQMLRRHEQGAADHSQGIWTLMMFELWHRQMVEASLGGETEVSDNGERVRSSS